MKSKRIKFTVAADYKDKLEIAIREINSQSGSDYDLVHYERHEVGLATIEVSEDKIIPEFLFMMGHRYCTLCKSLKLKF